MGHLTQAARLLRYFAVYRRLRNFEAAVDNSTSIDRVIESIIDGVFWLGMIFFFLNMEFGLVRVGHWNVSLISRLICTSYLPNNRIHGQFLFRVLRLLCPLVLPSAHQSQRRSKAFLQL